MLTFRDKVILFPLWLLSLFPLKVLYVKSWFLYVLIYHVFGYRRKVVYENLKRSFPEKTEKEIQKIAKKFYLHLCDKIFEVIFMIRLTTKDMDARYKVTNPEVPDELSKKNKSIVIAASHYANWEWASCVKHMFDYKLIGIYKPLSNGLFDRFFIHIRSRLGGGPVAMSGTLRAVMDSMRNKENFMLYLVGDQRPQWSDLKHWITFMNQETPVITGPEKLARRFNLATVFMDTRLVKRGYYEITFHVISENSKETEDFEITRKYFELVEEQIKRNPEFYTWSHKRWKYNKQELPGIKQNS